MAELRNGYNLNPDALWVGEVPNGWEFIKGKYLFGERFEKGNDNNLELLSPTQKYGVIPQNIYDELSGMRAVKVKESTDLSSFKTVHIGDFCISLRSFQGGFEYSKYEGVVSPAYHILYPKKKIVDGYFKYLFKEQSFIAEMNSYCQSLRDGKNISYDDFGNTLIPYPPLSEQQAIAAYLDERCAKIDELIAEAAASIAEYKELKQAVIFEAVTQGLDKSVPLKDSGVEWIGKIPVDWRVTKLKHFSKIHCGLTLGKKYPYGTKLIEYPYLRVANVQGGYTNLTDIAVIKVTQEEADKYRLQNGDLLMTEGGDRDKLGRGTVWHAEIDPCLHQNHIFVLRTNTSSLSADYVSYLTASLVGRNYFDVTANQCVHLANTNSTTIMNFIIPYPSIEEQKQIVGYLNPRVKEIDSLISEKQALIDDLQAYKKSLIYEVVTGKRRVG